MADRLLHSFVVPVYNEQLVLREFFRRFQSALSSYFEAHSEDYELIFVDDGSTDSSCDLLKEFQQSDPTHVIILSLSRNFGHQIALTAGLDHAKGNTVTVLDADLQDPPEVATDLLDTWRKGFDVVYAVRHKRKKETTWKKVTAKLFYRLFARSNDLRVPLDTADFRLMSRKAVNALNSVRERHRFLRGLAKWVGFKQTSISYVRDARFAGKTKYSNSRMIHLAWDAFSGFSLLPLRMATYLGFFAILVSLILACVAVYSHYIAGITVPGWTSLVITILFMGSVQLICLGILGEYIGRIFEESKDRPLYFISEEIRQ